MHGHGDNIQATGEVADPAIEMVGHHYRMEDYAK